MNKKEALKKIEELKDTIAELKEYVKQCDKEQNKILVPNNIVFESLSGGRYDIVFNNGKQTLGYDISSMSEMDKEQDEDEKK